MRNFLNLTKKFSDFSTFTRARATFSRICQRLCLATIATFKAFSDFQSQTRAGGHRQKTISKNRHKKIAAPAPDLFDPGRRASLFMYSGPGVYVQDVTKTR